MSERARRLSTAVLSAGSASAEDDFANEQLPESRTGMHVRREVARDFSKRAKRISRTGSTLIKSINVTIKGGVRRLEWVYGTCTMSVPTLRFHVSVC